MKDRKQDKCEVSILEEDICKCGHKESQHNKYGCYEKPSGGDFCKCKKFIPQSKAMPNREKKK